MSVPIYAATICNHLFLTTWLLCPRAFLQPGALLRFEPVSSQFPPAGLLENTKSLGRATGTNSSALGSSEGGLNKVGQWKHDATTALWISHSSNLLHDAISLALPLAATKGKG